MTHLFLAFLYSTRFLSKVVTEILGLRQSFSTSFPLQKNPSLTEHLQAHEHPGVSEELAPADGSSSHSHQEHFI